MANLTQDQIEKRDALMKGATITGAVVGVLVALVLLWILSGQGAVVRFGGAAVAGLAVAYFVRKARFDATAKDAKCGKCGAAFSRSRTDRAETLAASTPKEEREEQEDKSVKVTTWTEDTFDVVDTYTCAACGDTDTRAYQTTRRRDEKTEVEPAPVPKGWARTAAAETPEDQPAPEPEPKAPAPGGWTAPAKADDAAPDTTDGGRGRGRRR